MSGTPQAADFALLSQGNALSWSLTYTTSINGENVTNTVFPITGTFAQLGSDQYAFTTDVAPGLLSPYPLPVTTAFLEYQFQWDIQPDFAPASTLAALVSPLDSLVPNQEAGAMSRMTTRFEEATPAHARLLVQYTQGLSAVLTPLVPATVTITSS
jgi:hypothetical protein